MPILIDISSWNEQKWFSTGGTRSKKYIQSPDLKYYYFKRSYKKEVIDYKFEFWSEILAFEIGTALGFKVLKYDLAIDNENIGCICESMIDSEKEELIEGVKYLQAYDNSFDPSNKIFRKEYSFQRIETTLLTLKIEKLLERIIEMLVFDSVIGNGDRHQENWAIVSQFTPVSRTFYSIEGFVKRINEALPNSIQKILSRFRLVPELHIAASIATKIEFAPLYDNGSSLGRELDEARVERLLSDSDMLSSYIRRGVSEIHWNGEKLGHFELLKNLLVSHEPALKKIIERTVNQYNDTTLKNIIFNIDSITPDKFIDYRLSKQRKELIHKMILLRIEELSSLIR